MHFISNVSLAPGNFRLVVFALFRILLLIVLLSTGYTNAADPIARADQQTQKKSGEAKKNDVQDNKKDDVKKNDVKKYDGKKDDPKKDNVDKADKSCDNDAQLRPPEIKVHGAMLPGKQKGDPRPGNSIELAMKEGLAEFKANADKCERVLTLFLNGIDAHIKNEDIDIEAGTVRFRLERNAKNKEIWAAILRDPFEGLTISGLPLTRPVKAGLGLSGEKPVSPRTSASFRLVVADWDTTATFWLIMLAMLFSAFVFFVRKRDMLRDGPYPHPYSLGRCQMAWWFLLIVVSYVMIWLISGNQDTITPSLLTLMGISAGTGLGAILIEKSSGAAALPQAATDRLALQAAQQNAQKTIDSAAAAAAAAPADLVAQKNLDDATKANGIVSAKLLAADNVINNLAKVPQTRNLIRDILSDSDGTVGLHRFQIVVWTIVLGIIFLVSVVKELSMPEFSNTLLATMGISAGTYLGFKFPEK